MFTHQKDRIAKNLYDWMGEENLRWFKHLKGLTGSYAPVLKLNQKRKGIPVHPVHLREGMQIRNFLRNQEDCKKWSHYDFDDRWTHLLDWAIKKYVN